MKPTKGQGQMSLTCFLIYLLLLISCLPVLIQCTKHRSTIVFPLIHLFSAITNSPAIINMTDPSAETSLGASSSSKCVMLM
ncbi:hypothetical protein XELAEV_18026149mg [Xenopus laevis]|uniref:Uncharacterized protein n=1 Tax=Xenopus laevis TaxID=8355 RepID=A0A974HIH9_XENLA|nr:hypothetical protein XELAEV_18026149mg [Xenopus laevis]